MRKTAGKNHVDSGYASKGWVPVDRKRTGSHGKRGKEKQAKDYPRETRMEKGKESLGISVS